MNANVLSALADSGLFLVASSVIEDEGPALEPLQFVPADAEYQALDGSYEDPGCQCCCCTGECREYDTAEEFEAAGFYLEQEMDVVVNAWHQVKFWVDGGSDLS